MIKTISAERSSTKSENKVTKEVLIAVNILNTIEKALSILLAPKLAPCEKIEFEVTHIPIKKMLHDSSKQNDAHFWLFFRGLTLIFSRMLENLIAGSLGEVN